jgi:N-acetylneuraminic acid mutarotase
LKDFWEYNTEKDYWVQKADFPGVARNGAVAFTVGSMGYVGTGFDGDNKLKDFYQYDPATNKWAQKADFAGTARYGAVGFGLDTKGYIGTGYDDNYQKDFYEYDPATNVWTKIVSIGGQKRRDASAFVLNNKGYVVSGLDNGSYLTDLYNYDPAKGEWTKMRDIYDKSDESYDDDYSNIARISAVAFTVNGKGYLTLGSSSSLLNTLWEYNPTTDLWNELTAFEGTIRTESCGFGVGNYGYVTTGRSNAYYLEDIWRLNPTEEYDENN